MWSINFRIKQRKKFVKNFTKIVDNKTSGGVKRTDIMIKRCESNIDFILEEYGIVVKMLINSGKISEKFPENRTCFQETIRLLKIIHLDVERKRINENW